MVRIQDYQDPGRTLGCETHKWKDGPSCVIMYTSDTCIFCPAAKEFLQEMMDRCGMSKVLISEVDCDREQVSDVSALPTINIYCIHGRNIEY